MQPGPWPERVRFGWRLPSASLFWLTLAPAIAVGAMLRLHGIASHTLSFDEGATDYFAHLPLTDL